jgi:hypothetical protein
VGLLDHFETVPGVDQEHPMTVDEFIVVRQWMKDRWPSLESRREGEWRAYYDELLPFRPAEVMMALSTYIGGSESPEFPPLAMKLARLCKEARGFTQPQKALEAPKVDGAAALDAVTAERGVRPSRAHLSLGDWVGSVFHPKEAT